MFLNMYLKKLKSVLRDKTTLFWTLLFPIILSTLFYFSFSTLDQAHVLEVVKVAVVDDAAFREDETFKQTLESLSQENDDQIFDVTFTETEKEADKLLKDGDVEGYIIMAEAVPALTVKDTGISQTVLKGFLDSYLQTKNTITEIIKSNPQAISEIADIMENTEFTKEVSYSENPPTDTINYFYALLSMVAMYGSLHGLKSITALQGNLSSLGARRILSPASRLKVVLADLLGALTIQFGTMLLLLFYMMFVLEINFGNQLGYVVITCFAGSMVGVSLGAMISVPSRMKAGMKVALMLGISMLCSFLSGLMVQGVNYTVAKSAPVVALLNPAARVTDAFYCLYYYDTYERYFLNIGIIFAMAIVFFIVTSFFLRRQRYDSI